METLSSTIAQGNLPQTTTPALMESSRRLDWLEGLLTSMASIQQQGIEAQRAANAQRSRAVENDQMDRLAETINRMALSSPPSAPAQTRRPFTAADLRNSDIPTLSDAQKDPAAVLNWIARLEMLFDQKGMAVDEEKIKAASIGLTGIEIGNWYRSHRMVLVSGSWGTFTETLKMHVLPPNWESNTLRDLHRIKMTDTETFMAYSARGRALQAVLAHKITDLDLAEHLVAGMPRALYLEVEDTRYLRASDFNYASFEEMVKHKYDKLQEIKNFVKQPVPRFRAQNENNSSGTATTPASNPSAPMSDDTKHLRTWRFKSYFNANCICRWCKTKCSTPSPGMKCTNARSSTIVRIPADYQAPPMPPLTSDGFVPEPPVPAWTNTSSRHNPGQPTSRPAGASAQTLVCAIEEMPSESVDVAETYEALDEFIQAEDLASGCAPPSNAPMIVELICNGKTLRCLADTGSGTNLMSKTVASDLQMQITPLQRPVRVKLAIANNATPEVLTHVTSGTFRCEEPNIEFGTAFFKLARLHDQYDCILGGPFLSKFKLDVSLATRCVKHVPTGLVIPEKSALERQKLLIAAALNEMEFIKEQSDLSGREESMLSEYADLFLGDIPAVGDGEDEWLSDSDGITPPLMQKESAKVRHKIVLTDPSAVINERQYGYPQKYLAAWRKLLDQHLAAGRIRKSCSQYASPSMIVPKKDCADLPRWVCDFRTLNKFTVKERSPLPNVDEAVRLVGTVKVYSKVDMTNSFFQTRMREADIPLTAVKTPWGLYEWVVMPMGLTNSPATHQSRMEEVLGDLVNVTCVVYIDDIVIFSNSVEEHEKHLREVMDRLRSERLYCSSKKTQFFRREIEFLGHKISAEGTRPVEDKVKAVRDWKTPRSPKTVRQFLGTVGWMKKFIDGLEKHLSSLTPLTSVKMDAKSFAWGEKEEVAFQNIKRLITTLPCLKNLDYDSDEPVWLFTDASASGIGAALFQGKEWDLSSPIAYESRLMTPAEQNYPVHEQELLAIVHALTKWRLLLLGMKVNVMTDHHSITHLLKQRTLSWRQARWLERLSEFDLKLNYIRGKENTIADALSRKDADEEAAAVTVMEGSIPSKIMANIKAGYEADQFCRQLRSVLPLRKDCVSREGLLYLEDRLVIPNDATLKIQLIKQAHLAVGHLGFLKTYHKVKDQFFWPGLNGDVKLFVQSCDVCQRTKARTTTLPGKMQTSEVPRRPLEDIALDFIGPLPKMQEDEMILSVTCRLSGFTRAIPACQSDTAERTAQRLFGAWISIFGSPSSMTGDRDKIWISRFWKEMSRLMCVDLRLTTAYRAQSNGQAERSNKTIVQILRQHTMKRQSRWLQVLPATEHAINSALNVSIGMTPFELVFGRKPHLFPLRIRREDERLSATWIEKREAKWAAMRDRLWESQVRQALQYNRRRSQQMEIKADDWVLLDAANRGRLIGGAAKLKARYEGPYRVKEVLNNGRNFVLYLQDDDCTHNNFHVSKVKLYYTAEQANDARADITGLRAIREERE